MQTDIAVLAKVRNQKISLTGYRPFSVDGIKRLYE